MPTKTSKKQRRKAEKKAQHQPLVIEPEIPVIEPEIVEAEETVAYPKKIALLEKAIARIRRARFAIAKKVEKRALKLGISPAPLVAGIWEIILLLPRLARLILKLITDPRVPLRLRILCGLSLVYLISPIDLIPVAVLGPAGILDDLALLLVTLNLLVNEVDPEVVKEHWTGDEDVLRILRESISLVDWFVPKAIEKTIKKFFTRKPKKGNA